MIYENFKLFPISFSKLSKFETCEYQWFCQYVEKNIQFVDSPATVWGSDVHSAFDERFKTGIPLEGRFADYEKYATLLEQQAHGAKLFSEFELVVDVDEKQTAWDSPTAHLRGRTDVQIFYPDGRCLIFDHKTGSRRPNDELEFFSMLTFMIFPEVHTIKTLFAWYKEVDENGNCKTDSKIYKRTDLPAMRTKFSEKINKIESALEFDTFKKSKSGLCRSYCGSPTCNYSGQFKKEKK